MNQRSHPISDSQSLSTMDKRSRPISDSQSLSTMDRRSRQISPPSPRPPSSVYSDDMPIMTYLIRQVSEETRLQEYQTIASYMRENQALEEELELYRKAWNGTIMLANEVIKAITVLKRSLITVDANVASAEKDWLAFWGIYQESVGSHPPLI